MQGADLSNREELRQIQEAALTLVFRFMFLLHTEAPRLSPRQLSGISPAKCHASLADDCRRNLSSVSRQSTSRWDRLRTLVRMVRTGDPTAGVPAYNGSLFAADGFPGSELLESAAISDNFLAHALAAISFDTDAQDVPGLDFAGLDVGHLGAIYEKLLSFRLTRAPEDLAYDAKNDFFRPPRAGEKPEITRAQLYYQAEAGGRKAGGVYYTRREFVDHLLNHSLVPALNDHLETIKEMAVTNPAEAARRLFDFSVVDPAMGSAHFLTVALDKMADRIDVFLAEIGGLPAIADELKELTQDSGAVSQPPEAADLLRRLILKRCIFGVDISPMAVEVANVTLWLASFVPGLSLSWLGSNLKCGDALIGVADPSVLKQGDSPLLTGEPVIKAMAQAAELQQQLAMNPDRTPEEVKRSEQLSDELRDATVGLRTAFDMWAAEPLGLEGARHALETSVEAIISRDPQRMAVIAKEIAESSEIADQYRFFHWPLEFPNVFHRDRRGFDVVVGNPPWNKVKFEMPSFLALHDPGIRGLRSGLDRDERAARLFSQRPELEKEVEDLKSRSDGQRAFYRPENGFKIQGSGDTDLYKLFCERYASIARAQGYMGVVLPRVAFLNDGSRGFRRWFFRETRPVRIDTILNSGHWAFDMEQRYSIALVTAQVGAPREGSISLTGPARSEQEFEDNLTDAGVLLDLNSLASWSPSSADDANDEPTWELPLLPTQRHVEVLTMLRRGVRFDKLRPPEIQKIAFGKDQALPDPSRTGRAAAPNAIPYREIDSAQQRALFTHPPGEGRISVWKGSSFDQYEPFEAGVSRPKDIAGWGSPESIERFLLARRLGSREFRRVFSEAVLHNPSTHPYYRSRIAFRAVTNRTNSRTAIGCLVPPRTPLTDRAPYLVFQQWPLLQQAYVLGVFNSIPFDWQARRAVETTFSYFILNTLTFPLSENTPLAAHR